MTENDLKLLGRQVGSKALAADRELRNRSCDTCRNGISLLGCVVCKITGLPITNTRGGCHKYDERINYE